MNKKEIKLIQRAIEKFFISVGFNIALYLLTNTDEYEEFRAVLGKALEEQVLYYAKIQKVDYLLGVAKAVRQLTEQDILDKLNDAWKSFTDFMDDPDEFLDFMKLLNQRSGEIILEMLQKEDEFEITTASNKEISKHLEQLIVTVDNTTKSWIARTVEEGLKRSYSHVQIAKMLRDNAEKLAEDRSQLIIEHESSQLINEVAYQLYNTYGVPKKKLLLSRDELSCDSCSDNQKAGEIDLVSNFPSGHKRPPFHNRCQCFLLPIYE